MQDLIKQEQFEIEVLSKLSSKKLLSLIVFTGGTMLRLCHGLNRFSIDLDFWVVKELNFSEFYNKLKNYLTEEYNIKDAMNKFYTILFEIKSKNYPRSLKIEIRKAKKNYEVEKSIAYSKYSNMQVLLKTVELKDMMNAKFDAFLDRGEIRDCFDMEFLFKKGVLFNVPEDTLQKVIEKMSSLSKIDYTVKLGSLLENPEERKYYVENGFKILKTGLNERVSNVNK
ncbi:MAG: hypothetical protein AUJ85_02315 [Elusimicrobia bacterium CG1_02_37_114]|nr:MAG: hypothetical protein AUJ85_02315 [Elusimicrobia bacterium CG1_02_37_114]PIV53350.1 MAG: hypothetical protein COS17_04325 [Elusimicrobia bacterium CG02_land_8_20_14_3_00_37_13]PIZ12953.1 MAG: hypothetical protein COY53_07355 [Elusimicrobia bacterium CG_4_10_14_0_8_um_filter_37_32]